MLSTLRLSPYGYTPTEYVCILFVVLFGLSTFIHAGQAIRYRMWWLFPSTVLAGALETLGWGGHLWSSINSLNFKAYEMQIVCTIIWPTPLAAANFIILGHIINHLGPAYSRLSPKHYTILFLFCVRTPSFIPISRRIIASGNGSCRISSHSFGGGAASAAVNKHHSPAKGGDIILAGITGFCITTITAHVFCAGEFLVRYLHNRPVGSTRREKKTETAPLDRKTKVLVCALVFNTTCLFIRAVYRVVELFDGWVGRIIQTQVYFSAYIVLGSRRTDVLDGAMITLAIITLNLAHPGHLLTLGSSPPLRNAENDANEKGARNEEV
ncbi:hypothetical protein DFH06DRAFT_1291799 [Mycena polygramma]|nr:hypothetical protein DFH06DRAFT_1291799 [Mycena polygramma]